VRRFFFGLVKGAGAFSLSCLASVPRGGTSASKISKATAPRLMMQSAAP
jgi:hypothetical protein